MLGMKDCDFLKLKKILIFTFILGLFAYGFFFFNSFYSHDSLHTIFWQSDNAWEVSLGRYLQPPFRHLFFGNITTTWFQGILGLLFLALTSFIICNLFDLRTNTSLIFVTAIVTLNLSEILLAATFIQWFCIFSCAQFLASFSAFLLFKNNRIWPFSILFLFSSLSLYQLYVSCFCVLFLLKLIQITIHNQKEYLLLNFKYVKRFFIVTINSALLYLLGLYISLKISNLTLSRTYNSLENAFTLNGKSLKLLFDVYISPITFYFKFNAYWKLFVLIPIIVAIIIISYYVVKKIKLKQIFFIVIGLLILPICSNFVVFLTNGMSHGLLLIPTFYLLLFVCLFIKNENFSQTTDLSFKSHILQNIFNFSIIAFILLFCFNSVQFSNTIAEKKNLESIQTLVRANLIVSRLSSIPNYIPGETPLFLVASQEKISTGTVFNKSDPRLKKYYQFFGTVAPSAITYTGTEKAYFENYLNLNMNLKGIQNIESITNKEKLIDNGYLFDNGNLYLYLK